MEEMPDYVTRNEFAPFQAAQNRIVKFLFGNGEPGWDETLRDMRDFMDEKKQDSITITEISRWVEAQKKAAEKRAEEWNKMKWVVVPVLVVGALGFMYQFIVFWLTIVPSLQSVP